MRNLSNLLATILFALALGAFFFLLGYAFDDWLRTGSTYVIKQLDQDYSAVLNRIWLDLKLWNTERLKYALIAAFIGVIIPIGAPLLKRKPKNNDSKFLTLADIRKSDLATKGGVFIGRAAGRLATAFYPGRNSRSGKFSLIRPRLRGGIKLYVNGDDVGGFVIGPPRSGKGASLIIPNALSWRHSLVVLDLRGETYDATAGFRATFSKVVRFAPADRNGDTAFYNPMDFISLDSAQRDIDLRNMAAALFPRPPASADPYWVNDARLLFTGLASYVMESPSIADRDRSFSTIMRIMNGADEPLFEFLGSLREERRHEASRFTLETLLPYADMSERQFSGVYSGVRTGMAPFLNERIMHATSRSSFDIRKLKQENISLYLDLRREQVSSLGPLFNVLLTQMMNFMSESIPQPGEHQVLVLLDEFQNLGKLENVTDMATTLGGNGISMWFFVQSLKAVDEIYREEGRKTLINAARVQIFFGAQDADDLRYVSEQLGEMSEIHEDVTRTQSTLFDMFHTRSVHKKEVRRPLMRPDEIRTMDKTKMIILPRGEHPILGTRNFWFADPKLVKLGFMPIQKQQSQEALSKPSPAVSTIDMMIEPARYRSGLTGSQVKRGATFAAKTGRYSRPEPVRKTIAPSKELQSAESPKHHAKKPKVGIDFGALASKAVSTRVSPEKEAAIASLLNTGASFKEKSSDPTAYERSLDAIKNVLPDVIDG